jgi:ubiquinone/menaquinone biosynthesis C-methylase UbiE
VVSGPEPEAAVARDDLGTSPSADYFHAVSPTYSQRYEEASPGGNAARLRKRRALELLSQRGDPKGGRLLDVGCGPGIMVEDALQLGYEFWGIDAAPGMIEQCMKRYGNSRKAHFAKGDAVKLEFPDEYFDTVLCMGVIDHIADHRQAIREMLRVLRRSGILLIACPNLHSPWAMWRKYVFYPIVALLKPVYFKLRGRRLPQALSYAGRLHTRRSICDCICSSDGVVKDVVYFNFNVMLSPLDECAPRITVWLTETLEPLHNGMLRWLCGAFIVKALKLPGPDAGPPRR